MCYIKNRRFWMQQVGGLLFIFGGILVHFLFSLYARHFLRRLQMHLYTGFGLRSGA